jgi:hypothetical protein
MRCGVPPLPEAVSRYGIPALPEMMKVPSELGQIFGSMP